MRNLGLMGSSKTAEADRARFISRRTRRPTIRKEVDQRALPAEQRAGARRARPRREGPGAEEGARVEDVGDARVEGSRTDYSGWRLLRRSGAMQRRCWVLRCCGAGCSGACVPGRWPRTGRARRAASRTRARKRGPRRQGVEREVRAVAARTGASWIGYRVADGRRAAADVLLRLDLWTANACCGVCRLESGGGVTMNTGDSIQQRGSRITLEPPSGVPGPRPRRSRQWSSASAPSRPDCDVDAGNMPIVWLTDVKPDDSIAWLSSLVTGAPTCRRSANASPRARCTRLRCTMRRRPIERWRASSRRRGRNGCGATPRSGWAARAERPGRGAGADDRQRSQRIASGRRSPFGLS